MDIVSRFTNPKLKPELERFADAVEKSGIAKAVSQIQEHAMGIHAEEIADGLMKKYEVSENDAKYFMQEYGRILSDHYSMILPSADKKAMLMSTYDTDLTTPVKHDLCVAIANEAVKQGDRDMLHMSCIEKSGMTIESLSKIEEQVREKFGDEELLHIQDAIKMKEHPEMAVSDIAKDLYQGETDIAGYVHRLSLLEKDIPDSYLESSGFGLSTVETQNGFAIAINMNGMSEQPYQMIQISDEEIEEHDGMLSVSKTDAIRLVQDNQIYGGNVMDCITEVNLPPEHPDFVSEMDQKFANYISAHASSSVHADAEAAKLASMLPDYVREEFLSARGDLQYEQNEQISEDAFHDDYDHDGMPDSYFEREQDEAEV